MKTIFAVLFCILILSPPAFAQIVDDNFDDYANDAAFELNWAPTQFDARGLLVPRTTAPFPPPPFDGSGDAGVTPPVEPVVGQAVAFNDLDGINEWTTPFSIAPSATEAVRYSADIFDFVQGNRRFSLGLRNPSPANLFELGFWNANTYDPTDPINIDPMTRVLDVPTTAYAYRITLIDSVSGDLVLSPNWQYFPLPIEFDDPVIDHNGDGRVGNGDGLVNPVDVGPGWHTYTATIETDHVTLELDLFRNGTVDSTVEWDLAVTSDPFTSLRMGGPSALSMNEFTMIDNVKLELVPIETTVDGDFNDDQQWDCFDINSLTAKIAAGTNDPDFDMTGDGSVNDDDLAAWLVEGGLENPDDTGGNPFLFGDATLDGTVDGQDFIRWNDNKFTPVDAWCGGDFTADGVVDGQDFVRWNNNKFMSSSGNLAAVPEPTLGLGLLIVAGLAFLKRR